MTSSSVDRVALEPRHAYLHAPFCARRCGYCDFAVHVASDPPVAAWVESIGRELRLVAGAQRWGRRLMLDTLYVGGGTPSLLGPGALSRALAGLAAHADTSNLREFTAEANPESFTPELAVDWRRAGVDRVSLGAQTFHEPSLRWMGRLHGSDGPERALARARAAGFENVGLDLIFGLPERLGRDLDDDLSRMLDLEPEHISVYGLSVESGTPLGRWVAEGQETMPEQDRYAEEYLAVAERLAAGGYTHYEVSNFARPGRESQHNAAYWRGVPYLGLGNGAHSYVPPRRWWNHRDWNEYRTVVAGGTVPVAGDEEVDGRAARLERVWLALRTRDGLSRAELDEPRLSLVTEWARRGWAEPEGGRVRLTPSGWLLLDRLAVELA
jgi:oxygen-independent coproporphyrinogen III oxidase